MSQDDRDRLGITTVGAPPSAEEVDARRRIREMGGAAVMVASLNAAQAEIAEAYRETTRATSALASERLAHAATRERLAGVEAAAALLAASARSAEPCVGEWVSGSGGHKEHAGGCSRIALWWDGMYAYCDEHAGERADGHYDRMPWRDVDVALRAYDQAGRGGEESH